MEGLVGFISVGGALNVLVPDLHGTVLGAGEELVLVDLDDASYLSLVDPVTLKFLLDHDAVLVHASVAEPVAHVGGIRVGENLVSVVRFDFFVTFIHFIYYLNYL